MRAANLRVEIQELRFYCVAWSLVLLALGVLPFIYGKDLGDFGSFGFMTSAMVVGLGLRVPRLLRRQQDRIDVLDEELLRLKVRSPFAHPEPMTIEE